MLGRKEAVAMRPTRFLSWSLVVLLMLVFGAPVVAQGDLGGDIYVGTWASNYLNRDNADNATFVHIERIAPNRYIVVSVMNPRDRYDHLTFIGGGFMRDDERLEITTTTGEVWLFSREVWVRGRSEAMDMSRSGAEEDEILVRIQEKFGRWPFPDAPSGSQMDSEFWPTDTEDEPDDVSIGTLPEHPQVTDDIDFDIAEVITRSYLHEEPRIESASVALLEPGTRLNVAARTVALDSVRGLQAPWFLVQVRDGTADAPEGWIFGALIDSAQ
jgi:hypothetical protein